MADDVLGDTAVTFTGPVLSAVWPGAGPAPPAISVRVGVGASTVKSLCGFGLRTLREKFAASFQERWTIALGADTETFV